MKKPLIVGVIILLITMGLTPSTETKSMEQSFQSALDSNTLYVGGNGSGNYTKIQDAIDDANPGDTVFVYSGIYFENIVVDKSIDMMGEDCNITTIDGRNYSNTVYIKADGVNISRFTIRNCSNDLHIAGINIVSDYNTIEGNRIVQNHGLGILLDHSSYNIIQNNIMINNMLYYIRLEGSSHNIIRYNKQNQSEDWHFYLDGIALSESSNNLICANEIRNLRLFVGIGLWDLSNNNTIRENTILNSKSYGSNLIQLWESHNNTVINNILMNNNGIGICLFLSIDNKIVGNFIKSVGNAGIGLAACKDTNIKNNNISSNRVGISIGIGSFLNIIQLNNIINNGMGLELEDLRQDPHIFGDCILNKIIYNNFIGNKQSAYDDNLFALNIWYGNYWNRPRILPKVIFGVREIGDNIKIPVVHFDLNPAQEPYDI